MLESQTLIQLLDYHAKSFTDETMLNWKEFRLAKTNIREELARRNFPLLVDLR